MSRVKNWIENNRGLLVEILLHTLAWTLYIAFYFLNNAFTELSFWHKAFYLMNILVFDLSIFYSLYLIAIPRLLQNKKSWRFVLILVLIVGLYPFAKHLVDNAIGSYFPDDTTLMSSIVQAGFWQAYLIRVLSCLFIVMMAGIGKFTFDWFKNMRIRTELENQNLISELAFLKSQINPHFLFNTLNNIHTLAYKKSDLAPDSIMKLSDLMRYMIYESDVDFVPLEKEITHLRSFIDLQELRFKAKGIVAFELEGDQKQFEIAPLLLLPFVENAFKHGANLNRPEAIRIKLRSAVDGIKFSIENELAIEMKHKDTTGGIGLENIRRRLELIYPKRHTLLIDQSSSLYQIDLTLW